MKQKQPLVVLIVLLALTGCQTTTPSSTLGAGAQIMFSDGRPAGTATLAELAGVATLSVSLSGLPAGERAMHLHATGSCVGPDFQSAGGHLNPHGKQHGANNPLGNHLGDLPNLTVKQDGTAEASVALQGSLADLSPILFDSDGTALVIHAAADDLVSDPAGNAGKRIACGQLARN